MGDFEGKGAAKGKVQGLGRELFKNG